MARAIEEDPAALRTRIEALEDAIGQCYQLAGEIGAPARVLDLLSAVSRRRRWRADSFLPIVATECGEVAHRQAVIDTMLGPTHLSEFLQAIEDTLEQVKRLAALSATLIEAQQHGRALAAATLAEYSTHVSIAEQNGERMSAMLASVRQTIAREEP